MPWTSCPASTRRGTSCFPIAPVAPATNTLIVSTPSSRITCASQHAVERPDEPEEDEGGEDKKQPTKQQDAVLAVGEGLGAEEAAPRHEASQRSEEHTSELQSRQYLVCRLLLEKKKKYTLISSTSTLLTLILSAYIFFCLPPILRLIF